MTYSYQHLRSDDLTSFKELLRVLGEAFEDIPTYQDHVPSDAYLETLLDKPHVIALAALGEGEVVGGLVAYVLDKFEQDRREIYIYDLAVAEAHRRNHIATGLIKELQRIAKERDAYVIFVQADYGDDPAIKLYESLGIREEVLHFDIPVKE